ncbi:MAG: shikimate kinase [Rhizobiaceae bacterium]
MEAPIRAEKASDPPSRVAQRLDRRSIVFIGLMGAGKTAIGRATAQALRLPFFDSDHEIERVSRMTVPELFEEYGEAEFRSLERRVLARLLKGGPAVISTGGGAFMNDSTRRAIKRKGISLWLKADLDTLMARVMRKQNRPLLKNSDPRAVMEGLMETRYPVYAKADITVISRDERKEVITAEAVEAVGAYLDAESREKGR